MAQPLLDFATPGLDPGDAWHSLDECAGRVPAELRPWLEEPGLLTARVRAACGPATALRLLKLEPAPIDARVRRRLGVEDAIGFVREIEISCGASALDLRAVDLSAVDGAAAPLAARPR